MSEDKPRFSLPDPGDLLKRYGISEEEVRRWAREKYPYFADNLLLMTLLYLKEVKDIEPLAYTPRKVVNLKPGERAELNVLIALKLSENRYRACPECYTKVDERNGEYYCPRHGITVEPIEVCWRRYIAGDDTGTIIIAIPPRIRDEIKLGSTYCIRGILGDRGEFVVRSISPIEVRVEVKPETVKAKPKARVEARPSPKAKEVRLEVTEDVIEDVKDYLRVWGELDIDEFRRWWRNMGYEKDYGAFETVLRNVRDIVIEEGKIKLREE